MFMLSFIFAGMASFEWMVCYCLFISLLQLGIQLSREGVGIRSTDFNPLLCCSSLRPRLWFVSAYVVVYLAFNDLGVLFVDVHGIVGYHYLNFLFIIDRIGSVIVNVLALGVVVSEFEPQFDQTKDYNIWIFCFSAKHSIRGWQHILAGCRNLDNEWIDMSTRGLMIQRVGTIRIQLSVLTGHHLVDSNVSSPWYSSKQHSFTLFIMHNLCSTYTSINWWSDAKNKYTNFSVVNKKTNWLKKQLTNHLHR